MKISRTDINETKSKLVINTEASELQPIRSHVLGHFRTSVKVPGFRSGKAPTDLLEKYIDQNKLQSEFLEHAVNEVYRQAVQTENIRPIGQPDVKIMKFVPYTELEVEITIDKIGQIVVSLM
jgi:trigger factor